MHAADNPFAPGAGSPPPQLAGRDEVLKDAEVSLRRVIAGTPDRGHMLLGLRGVGKTVLLNRIEAMAADAGYQTVQFEASERSKLADVLAPRLRSALVKLSRKERAKEVARRSLQTLRGFASAFKVTLGGVEIGVDAGEGGADTGDLEIDLPELLLSVGEAARAGASGVALLIDEVQYLTAAELSALLRAIHRVTQKNLPVILIGAGCRSWRASRETRSRTPSASSGIPGSTGSPRPRPRRRSPSRSADAGWRSLPTPSRRSSPPPGATPTSFLQEWGSHAWKAATGSPITLQDVRKASTDALLQLDNDFFRVRFDRLTPMEREYLRAMAELGEGPHSSGSIARMMGRTTAAVGPLREGVIGKGMAYSPRYGLTAFTVPMFDAFMLRTMPAWSPVSASRKPRGSKRKADADG